MAKTDFKESTLGIINYFLGYLFVYFILPLVLVVTFLTKAGLVSYLVPFSLVLVISNFLLLPINYITFIAPFLKKINLNQIIRTNENSLVIRNKNQEELIPFGIIKAITFLNYFPTLSFGIGNYIKNFGVFKITTENKEYFLPPTILGRDRLLKTIIKGTCLKKIPPTTSTNVTKALFVWQRDEGFFNSWRKGSADVLGKAERIEVVTTTQKFIAYMMAFAIVLAVILLLIGPINLPF